jgi:hypothetical protein
MANFLVVGGMKKCRGRSGKSALFIQPAEKSVLLIHPETCRA